MRRRRARWAAGAMGVGIVALVLGLAAMRPAATPAGVDGAAVYDRLGCPACHSLGGRGNTSIPLDGVGRRLDRDALRTWIVAPERMKPGVRKPAYDRVPAADVDAVVELLAHS